MKYCMHCGTELSDTAAFCTECGKPVPGTEPAAETPAQVNHIHIHQPPQRPASRKNGLGIGGFVLSIIGMVLSCIPVVGLISLILTIPGFLLSLSGLIVGICKKRSLGLCIAGIILTIASVIVMLALLEAISGFSL